VSRAPKAPCVFCRASTQVRISVKNLEVPGEPEGSQRICRDCFKAVIDHLMETRPPR
jgi:hypothetical protein